MAPGKIGFFQNAIRKTENAMKMISESPMQFINEIVSKIVTYESWNVYIWRKEAVQKIQEIPNIIVKKLTTEDLLRISEDPTRLGDQIRLFYIKRGIDSCYGYYVDGEMVFSMWIYTNKEYAKEPFETLNLKDNEVELKHALTRDSWKGKGLFPFGINYSVKYLLPENITTVYGTVVPTNISSIRACSKGGYVKCGYVWRFYFNFLPFGRKWAVRRINLENV